MKKAPPKNSAAKNAAPNPSPWKKAPATQPIHESEWLEAEAEEDGYEDADLPADLAALMRELESVESDEAPPSLGGKAGLVAIVGRPNVGKSTLLNALVGEKVSIVSQKVQTTRHAVQGVLHHPEGQLVFVDTPGIHRRQDHALNRYMNRAASEAISGVDVVLFVVEAGMFTEEDEAVLQRLIDAPMPVGLLINKVDKFAEKEQLLPEIQTWQAKRDFAFVVPLSAKVCGNRPHYLQGLVKELLQRIPESPPLYPKDQSVGYSLSFAFAETIREKLILRLHQELPYSATVEIEAMEEEGRLIRCAAVIWVERDGQKKIVIGQGGESLKTIGTLARKELEWRLNRKVYLQLLVKVKEGWTDDANALKRFGYH
jgi:GTP-binding protein Era